MEINYKNIIVAVDGSEASMRAFHKAISIAKNNQSHLIITHVIDSRTFATAEAYDRTLAERTDQHAKELMYQLFKEAKEKGLTNVQQSTTYGSPKTKITRDIAKQYEADLIICGATGMGAMERFLIGSVSESITRYAPCDVLIVR